MTYTRPTMLVAMLLLFVVMPISATPTPVPLFSVDNVDGQGDVPVGIQSNSDSYINLAGYTGLNNIFSDTHLTGDLGDGKSTDSEWTDLSGNGSDKNDMEDCDIKDGDSKSCKAEDDGGTKGVTPEPGSILLLGTGLVALGGMLRRKLLS